jgi:hypothetical protein
MDQLLAGVADDWRSTQDIGERLAKAKQEGASWRFIAYRTGIPTTTVRRWAAPFLGHDPAPAGAVTPRPAAAAGSVGSEQRALPAGPALGGRANGPRTALDQRATQPSDSAAAPRPGSHPAKNARRVGIPNHLQVIEESGMLQPSTTEVVHNGQSPDLPDGRGLGTAARHPDREAFGQLNQQYSSGVSRLGGNRLPARHGGTR